MGFILRILVFGLQAGAIYALVAIGIALVYKATGILNFAVGQFILLGCYLFFWVAFELDLPFLVALPIALAMIESAASGIQLHRCDIRGGWL